MGRFEACDFGVGYSEDCDFEDCDFKDCDFKVCDFAARRFEVRRFEVRRFEVRRFEVHRQDTKINHVSDIAGVVFSFESKACSTSMPA